jgi:hypothetical protein
MKKIATVIVILFAISFAKNQFPRKRKVQGDILKTVNITTPLNLKNRTITSLMEQLSEMCHKSFDHYPNKNYIYQLQEAELIWNPNVTTMPNPEDLISAQGPMGLHPAIRLILHVPPGMKPEAALTILVDYYPDWK